MADRLTEIRARWLEQQSWFRAVDGDLPDTPYLLDKVAELEAEVERLKGAVGKRIVGLHDKLLEAEAREAKLREALERLLEYYDAGQPTGATETVFAAARAALATKEADDA